MGQEIERIHQKLKSFKRKYYLDLFLRGLILSVLILSVYFLIATILEHNLWLSQSARFITFFAFVIIAAFCIIKFLREPLKWWIAKKGLTEEQSARLIGEFIPSVKDRLLNLIQLSNRNQDSLAYASILQKTREFEPLSFESVIDLKQNTRFAKYLLFPFVILLAILFYNKSILSSSTQRLINFNTEYSPSAPFTFHIPDNSLQAFYNEDFVLTISLKGNAVPDAAYVLIGTQRYKMERGSQGMYSHTIEKIQGPMSFQIEAAGFFSDKYSVTMLNRPELDQLKIELSYPRYLNRSNEQLINVGNLDIPEGTEIAWSVRSRFTEKIQFQFSSDSAQKYAQLSDNHTFTLKKTARIADLYQIILENKHSKNKDRISYSIDVIKDQYPSISVNNFQDSILYKRVLFGGTIDDDHGVSQLVLKFRVQGRTDEIRTPLTTVPISISKNQIQQNFFYHWSVDSLVLNPGDKLEYYLEVWDNDGVNGMKSTKTALYSFMIPTERDLMNQIKSSQTKAEEKIDQSVSKAQKLHDQIEQASQKLKGKQNINWQDKKMLEDIIEQKHNLDQVVEKLKEENKLLDQKKNSFTEQDQRIKAKADQIQKLMDELLDDETKKLFEELQKLLKENAEVDDIQKLLNKINQNTDNLEKELERMLELFKQIQFEYKLDQALEKLGHQIQQQKELLEKTEKLDGEKKMNKDEIKELTSELAKQQEEIKQSVKENADQLQELKTLGEELHNDANIPNEDTSDEIMKNQEESKEFLDQGNPAKAKPSQKQSLEKMQKMEQGMKSSQNEMAMEIDMENLESLRQIVHSLVKLSFDQESLLNQLNELTPNDPRFNSIAQNQLKLKEDSKVLEDSLLSLGKRDPFLGSVVTKEIGEMKNHLNKVIDANKERRRPQAAAEMQATMTSINNLALMLDDHFEMMMQMLANAKPSMGKPKPNGKKPSLSQMQQNLNNRIQQLKNSGKSGKGLSEELAEMAAEQERIRKALQEMQEKMKDGGMPGGQLPAKMEQTEMELVNKQLTDQLIRRQQEILTRLLETEKSAREQDLDDERKGETAKDYENEMPRAFEEYLRLREKEVELLKTVPPKLYPYYKREVNEYFKRMGK